MRTVDIHAARAHFIALVERAAAGEEIVITKAGKPMARLAPLEKLVSRRKPGMWKDLIEVQATSTIP